MNAQSFKIIHAACILVQERGKVYLLLRQVNPQEYRWFEETEIGQETGTLVSASTVEEAIRLARRHWKLDSFRTINCGFRYTLPERDEHGYNALFYQMVASYSATTGVYFDEELGSNCIIQNASSEARELWKRLQVTVAKSS